MPYILEELYDKIYAADTMEQYQKVVQECMEKLETAGYGNIADKIRVLSEVYINRFSKQSTLENFEKSKKKVMDFLKKEIFTCQKISNQQGVQIVITILEHFHDYCRCLYKEKIHNKCSDSLKRNLPCLKIENEYDLQRLMYPAIRSVFADARLEVTQDSGHHMVRKDIVIDSQDIVIELKCSSETVTERRLSEEIAADMIHYKNRHILFYIYDKASVIKNAVDFQKTYENKCVEGKHIIVRIWQCNDI